jgi:ADP-heptose:LPS heptosyltransferase
MFSSGPTRTYPPALGKLAVEALLEAFPDHHAVIIGMDKSVDFRVDSKRVVDLFNATANIRTLFPVIQGAEFVVAPDSSVTHMAAGLDTACVSLWGSYDPKDRVSFYPKSVPIFKPDTCPHAPCRPQGACRRLSVRTQPTAPRKRRCGAMRFVTLRPKILSRQRRRWSRYE